MELEVSSTDFFFCVTFLLQLVSFRVDSETAETDGVCRQIHFKRLFLMAVCTLHFMHITLHGSSVCMRASFHLHVGP